MIDELLDELVGASWHLLDPFWTIWVLYDGVWSYRSSRHLLGSHEHNFSSLPPSVRACILWWYIDLQSHLWSPPAAHSVGVVVISPWSVEAQVIQMFLCTAAHHLSGAYNQCSRGWH
jgi:hypothetical protein